MTGLQVFWDQKIVGTLTRHKSGKVVFQYDKEWLASDGRSISISLPCQQEKFAPGVSTAFFENLLPESRARSILAHNHRFDKKDTFAFLNTFGEDCAGALSIIPEEKEPDFTTGQYKCIDSELIEILNKIIEETLTAVGSQLAPLLGKHQKQYGKSSIYDELYKKIQENMRSLSEMID